jgi:hypothetical protein
MSFSVACEACTLQGFGVVIKQWDPSVDGSQVSN